MIPEPLVLAIGEDVTAAVLPDARYVAEQYRRRPSVYETNVSRILRGLIAEEVLARHRGVRRADVRAPYRDAFDVEPDIEVRAVRHPVRLEDWSEVCLTLYAKDRIKVARRWVLAMVDDDRIVYLGWQTGAALLVRGGNATSREGRQYVIAGALWPDELRSMEDLV